MGALPIEVKEARELPEYLPARMVNEFAYCPRLFFYEWVDGVFQESVDTVEGSIQHKRVDEKATPLPEPEKLPVKMLSTVCSDAATRMLPLAWTVAAPEVGLSGSSPMNARVVIKST